NNLATLYREMGERAAALPLFRQALDVRRTALGEAHPDFAQSLNNLATLYQDMGEHAAALPLFRQALEIRRAALGEGHPSFASSLNGLASSCAALGRAAEALPLLEQALAVQNRHIAQLFSIGSERQRSAFLSTLYPTQHRFLSLVCQELAAAPEPVAAA